MCVFSANSAMNLSISTNLLLQVVTYNIYCLVPYPSKCVLPILTPLPQVQIIASFLLLFNNLANCQFSAFAINKQKKATIF